MIEADTKPARKSRSSCVSCVVSDNLPLNQNNPTACISVVSHRCNIAKYDDIAMCSAAVELQ